MADAFPQLEIQTHGLTDSGKPLHLAVLSTQRTFDAKSIQESGKLVFMINNAIHPGEPDGVDATLMLFRKLLLSQDLKEKYADVVLIAIPFYNIGGALNRNSTTRANQEGPVSYGFRGNAQNLDLNRDFIKSDSRNARSFATIFNLWQPDVFVDTHVSNGANYQYTLTCLPTQADKLAEPLGSYLRDDILPALYDSMQQAKDDMVPYVNVWGSVPDSGYVEFLDNPRYSTGYTTLHHTIGFMTETHMLKPFKQRTESTLRFLQFLLNYSVKNREQIQALRAEAIAQTQALDMIPIQWEVNKEKHTKFNFKGYEASIIPSEVTTGNRLFYDESKPFTKEIKWFNHYQTKKSVKKPSAYVIPEGWHQVIDLLTLNNVQMHQLAEDSTISVTVYTIDDYQTSPRPYEKHYLHRNTSITSKTEEVNFLKGTYLIPTDQPKLRFLIETLEPEATDSYFNWNFFDAILQSKEHYSAYVFEDKAKVLLDSDADLKAKFDHKMANDPAFAKNPRQQLNFIYQHSPYAEKSFMRYPVYRIE